MGVEEGGLGACGDKLKFRRGVRRSQAAFGGRDHRRCCSWVVDDLEYRKALTFYFRGGSITMRNSAMHGGICWLLSGLLTASNGLPLVLEHAHPVGQNLQHDFNRGMAELPANGLPGGTRSSRPRGCECSAAVLAVTPHIHLVWFGFEFTLLAPDGAGPEQDQSTSACGSFARMADNRPLDNGRLLDRGSSAFTPPAINERAITSGLVAPPARRAARDVASLPLCDTARHERSGVQLI